MCGLDFCRDLAFVPPCRTLSLKYTSGTAEDSHRSGEVIFFPTLGGCMEFCSILYTNILKVGEWAILEWKSFCLFTPLSQYDFFFNVRKLNNKGI